jgi:tRNA-splicing ligase RtcB (3'-phosphate/5'-hydroxy nucleic acid ligase)
VIRLTGTWAGRLRKIDEFRWEIPRDYKIGMRVPGLVFADEHMMTAIREDQALEQVANVACLPGIVDHALGMPDIHWGYGFPVGGVAAMRLTDGVVSPGGIGYDINCGVRLLSTTLTEGDVSGRLTDIANQLFRDVPSGMGQEGRLPLQSNEMRRVLESGAAWAIAEGFGRPADLDHIEEHGCLSGASADAVSDRAKARGTDQLGTLGSGNHFLEVQAVDQVLDPVAAARFGLGQVGQVAVFIHTGSRGLGHQVCEDFLRVAEEGLRHYGFTLPDRQLACMPFGSPEAKRYLAGMAAAANFAFANRQMITHWVREAFARVLKRSDQDLGLGIVYDVAHNIAKVEEYEAEGKRQSLCVHRKGATRAFPAGDPSLPLDYRDIGQPVLIPGDMGRYSFVAVGTEMAMRESFGSVCHGAGRLQSRTAARRSLKGVDLVDQLGARGIVVRVHSRGGLVEEASQAYKDVAEVMRVVAGAGLARPVVRLRPLAVIKG